MSISVKDYRKCLDLIELIYSAPGQESMFKMLCERLQQVVGISTGIIAGMNPGKNNLRVKDLHLFNVPMQIFLMFTRHYANVHPLPLFGKKQPQLLNSVNSLNDIISDARLSETEYSRDFQSKVPTFYEVGCTLGMQGDPVGIVGFHRPKKDGRFTKREKEILNVIFPHLSRSLHIGSLLTGKAADSDCGIIEMDKKGRALHINEEARFALNGRPANIVPDAGVNAGPVFFRNGAYVYKVRTVPMRWGSVEKTIILEPCPDRHNLQSKLKGYGLTRRQEDVAILTIRGLANKEIADRLFISEQTVRDHLRDIFEKTGVHSRSELTAKIMGIK
ncbi:MAG: helix-turn-helix transcriptional regulator [Nitrospinae bacterium]|nr:helix-turn-helix transcriptional regulator [Nitrospinota bacterium]